jgi:arylsulfatase A-like enzyme
MRVTSHIAISLLVVLGCDAPSDDADSPVGVASASGGSHRLVYPLVAYETDTAWRTQVKGGLETAWLDLSGRSERALVARRGPSSLTFRLDSLAGGALRTRIGLFTTQPSSGGSAQFRVQTLRAGTSEPQRELFAASLGVGETRELRLDLPPDAFRIRLEVAPDPHAIATRAWPAWLEPIIERGAPRSPAAPDARSVLLVTVDTLRADVLGSYGGPVETPALDRIAQRGVQFLDAHSVAFGTAPSHASLLTSRPASAHGVTNNLGVLHRDERTLAEVLAEHGYHTAAFVSGIPLSRRRNLAQGFDLYEDAFIADVAAGLAGTARAQRRAGRTREQLERWLETIPPDEPVFAWVHLFDPHQPYAPPDRAKPLPLLRSDKLLEQNDAEFARIAEAAWASYQGEVAYVDRELGRILDRMQGRDPDSQGPIVVFTADHGETFVERDRRLAFDHTSLHPEITHIPLLIAAPGSLLNSRDRFRELVASTDIAPTVLGLLGIAIPESFTGRNLVPWLVGTASGPPHQHLVLEGSRLHQVAIRTGDWLYRKVRVRSKSRRAALGFAPDGADQLYALDTDPRGLHDVSANEPEVAAELARLVVRLPARPTKTELELDPKHRAALESLGYVDE